MATPQGCVRLICSVSTLLMCYSMAAALAQDAVVPPSKLHLKAWVPLPDSKLLLVVRDTQAHHMLEGQGCTSLDGPRCIDSTKSEVYAASEKAIVDADGKPRRSGQEIKIKILQAKVKPGQTIEEAVQEALEQAEEKHNALAQSASLRNGVTLEEARRALESADLDSGNTIQISPSDMDVFMETMGQMVEAGTQEDLEGMLKMLRSSFNVAVNAPALADKEEAMMEAAAEADEDYKEDDDYDDSDDYDDNDYNDDDYDDSDDYDDNDYNDDDYDDNKGEFATDDDGKVLISGA